MVRISDRLRTVAHMCEKGAVVADIGTDHGYLPIYLVQEGIAPSAIAMDLRKGPLDKAKKHICDNCLGQNTDKTCRRIGKAFSE